MKKRVHVNQLDRSGGPLWRRFQRLKFQAGHPLRYLALRDECRKSRAIFVHIPKCAGTSIRESFGTPRSGHATLVDYQLRLPAGDFSLLCQKLNLKAALREKNRNSLRAQDYRDNSSLPAQIAARDGRDKPASQAAGKPAAA